MSTFGKVITGIIIFVIVATIAAVVIFVNKLGDLVETGVETYGSEYLQAPVQIDGVKLSLLDGEGSIQGMTVGNPEGFSTDNALDVEKIKLALNIDSLTAPVIVIKEITVDGAAILFEQQGSKKNNLQTLMKNVEAATASDEAAEDSAQSTRELAIKEFNFNNASVTLRSDLTGEKQISVPDIQLTDLGTEKDGLGAAEAVKRMMEPIVTIVVKEALGGVVKKELDKFIDKNEKLKGLKSLIKGISKPPSD